MEKQKKVERFQQMAEQVAGLLGLRSEEWAEILDKITSVEKTDSDQAKLDATSVSLARVKTRDPADGDRRGEIAQMERVIGADVELVNLAHAREDEAVRHLLRVVRSRGVVVGDDDDVGAA